METKAIINCICKIVGDENVVVTYEDTKGKTAYLNCFHSKEDNIFQELCVRLREQLLRVVLYKPSWYVQFWQENDASELFNEETLSKVLLTSNKGQFAKWTGFPGQIIRA
ncbi:uncharacterized protein [Acropora muricata]|uniref:uncharacterized protein n=1 Tax=Acropora muricata TaxID=159855 RepID=UPI0034E40088